MTDRKNNDRKVETFETEKTTVEKASDRSNSRKAGKNSRRSERYDEGVPVYERATTALPAGSNLSWGSIFAGAITAAACFAMSSWLIL